MLAASSDVDHHLEQGKRFLQEGQLSDALLQYSAAVGVCVCVCVCVRACVRDVLSDSTSLYV